MRLLFKYIRIFQYNSTEGYYFIADGDLLAEEGSIDTTPLPWLTKK